MMVNENVRTRAVNPMKKTQKNAEKRKEAKTQVAEKRTLSLKAEK